MRARMKGIAVLDLVRELGAIADEGLRRQAVTDREGRDERLYLEPVREALGAPLPGAGPGAARGRAPGCPGDRGALGGSLEGTGRSPPGGQRVSGNAPETFLKEGGNGGIRGPNFPVQAFSSREGSFRTLGMVTD